MGDATERKRPFLIRLGETAVGAVAATQEMVQSGVDTVRDLAGPIVAPLDALGVTALVKAPVNAMSAAVETTVTRLEERGRVVIVESQGADALGITAIIDAVIEYLTRNPEVNALIDAQVGRLLPLLANSSVVTDLVRSQVALILPELADSAEIKQLVQAQVDAVLPSLADNEAIQKLIQVQAAAYMKYLQANSDTLQELIRTQGDTYIDYLNLHPDSVQMLVQGQSIGLAGQVLDEVRERTVTADTALDMIVRGIFRRKPREELPSPPELLQRRAELGRLPTDFTEAGKNGDR